MGRKVQKAIEELGHIAKPAEARAIVSGKERTYKNGRKERELNKIVDGLWRDMNHKPVFRVLPLPFTEDVREESQIMSLRGHAEKIALADLLLHGEEELHLIVNINMCADCHAFLLGASKILKRKITVIAGSSHHILFDDG